MGASSARRDANRNMEVGERPRHQDHLHPTNSDHLHHPQDHLHPTGITYLASQRKYTDTTPFRVSLLHTGSTQARPLQGFLASQRTQTGTTPLGYLCVTKEVHRYEEVHDDDDDDGDDDDDDADHQEDEDDDSGDDDDDADADDYDNDDGDVDDDADTQSVRPARQVTSKEVENQTK